MPIILWLLGPVGRGYRPHGYARHLIEEAQESRGPPPPSLSARRTAFAGLKGFIERGHAGSIRDINGDVAVASAADRVRRQAATCWWSVLIRRPANTTNAGLRAEYARALRLISVTLPPIRLRGGSPPRSIGRSAPRAMQRHPIRNRLAPSRCQHALKKRIIGGALLRHRSTAETAAPSAATRWKARWSIARTAIRPAASRARARQDQRVAYAVASFGGSWGSAGLLSAALMGPDLQSRLSEVITEQQLKGRPNTARELGFDRPHGQKVYDYYGVTLIELTSHPSALMISLYPVPPAG